jgi:hypothetical protein
VGKTTKSSKSSPRNRTGRAKKSAKQNKNGGRRIIRLPYVKKIGQRGPIGIWQVDGSYIRTHIDEEFTNYGQHFSYRYIPKEEFWLDQGISEEETKFFIKHLSVEHRLMKQGVDADAAREKADQVEGEERKRAGDVRKLTRGGRVLPDPAQVHRRLWKNLENRVSVWIVKARLVRSVFDDDFASGGHDHVYEYIPENEIWIDDTLKAAERPYALLHELHEYGLMKNGMDYDRAHAESSKLEHRCRRHPDELHEALANEGWE